MPADIIHSQNLDANETVFFQRELAYVKSQTYDRLFPEYTAERLIPVSTAAGAGATSIIAQSFSPIGMAKIIANFADDLPRVDVIAEETPVAVRSIGDSYGYSVMDIRSSAMVKNAKLQTRKADAAKRAITAKINRLAWLGRPAVDNGITGLVYNPNISVSQAPNNVGDTSSLWVDKTPDEILKDLNGIVNGVFDVTNGVERPDTVLLDNANFALIASTARSATSDTTILDYFLKNNPFVKSVEPIHELKAVNPRPSAIGGSANCMIAYTRSNDKLELEIPQVFEQMAVQPKGLEFVVPCHARTAGVVVYYPLSVSLWENI